MGTKLTNAPVFYTVVQVQFNPVLDMDGYIPAIQAEMRRAQFPDYRKEVLQQLVIPYPGSGQGQANLPLVAPGFRYVFGDLEGRSLFLLETNALSFQTTKYDTFKSFSEDFLLGLRVLHSALRLDFVDRIGLRYLDAVLPRTPGETLRDFLVPEVLGLSFRNAGELQHSMSETVFATTAGHLVSRVLIRKGRVGLPLELAGFAPTIEARFTQSEGLHAILDTDASLTCREVFDLAEVQERLLALHDELSKAFNATVTDHARASWA